MSFGDYDQHDAVGLAELVRRGEVHPTELAEAAIDRIRDRNEALGAVVYRRFDEALVEAGGRLPAGPLQGVPFLLKDLASELSGFPQTSGSRYLRGWTPDHDSELVQRYRAAGLVILGRTNSPEFGVTPVTEPALHGPARNPWNLALTAGGSSGGAAAAVASGMVPTAHGSDGGGSIRIPSSCCGLFGLKPTRGRTPTGPVRGPTWQGASVAHAITRSVRDSAALLDATAGPDPGAPYWAPPAVRPYRDEVDRDPGRLRIAFTTNPFLAESVDPECVRAVEDAARLLEDLGHEVEEARPDVDRETFTRAFITVVAAEVRAEIDEIARMIGRDPEWDDLEPATWALAMLGRATTAGELVLSQRDVYRGTRIVGRFFERWDMLLTPTLASLPLPVGSLQPSPAERAVIRSVRSLHAGWALKASDITRHLSDRTYAFVPFTPIFNATGQPAMSVPLYWTASDVPVGVQLAGRFGDEGALFRLAGQLERARPWRDRRPPAPETP